MSDEIAQAPWTPTGQAYRWLYRAGYPAARLWWALRRPMHHGALAAIWVGEMILLVRTSYQPGWSLPGGGVKRGETAGMAAARELGEELGLHIAPWALGPVFTVAGIWEGRRDTVDVHELRLAERPRLRLDGREIVAARYADRATFAALRLAPPVRAYADALGPGS